MSKSDTGINFLLRLMGATTEKEVGWLLQRMFLYCNDADQLAEGLVFATDEHADMAYPIAKKLIPLTSSPFQLITVMSRVPDLQDVAWERFMELNPSDIALKHACSVPGVRRRCLDTAQCVQPVRL